MATLPEAILRVRLLQTAQQAANAGFVVASLGNVSVRHPRHADQLMITPSGVPYDQMSSRDVVTMDMMGRVHRAFGKRAPSSEWRVHAGIYRARSDVSAIVHTHAPHAQAFSFLGRALTARTEDLSTFVGGDVPLAQYAPSGSDKLAANAAHALGSRQAVLLARHGLVSVGASLDAAYWVCRVVEDQARLAWLMNHADQSQAHGPDL